MIEIHIRLIKDDPFRVETPLKLDATIPSRSKQRLLTRGQIENHQIAQAANESEFHAIGRRRWTMIIGPGFNQWTDLKTHGIRPTRGVKQRIGFVFWLCVVFCFCFVVCFWIVLRTFFFGRLFGILPLTHVRALARALLVDSIRRIERLGVFRRRFLFYFLIILAGSRPIRIIVLDLFAGPRHGRCHDRRMAAIRGRKVKRGSVGAPGDIPFSAVGFGHSASGRVIRGASNHDLTVGNHRDRFSIRVKRCLGDPSRDIKVLFRIKRVFRRRNEHRPWDRFGVVEVKREERVPSMKNNFLPIGSCIESRNVDVLKVGNRLGIPAIKCLSINVLSRVSAIREEEDGIIT